MAAIAESIAAVGIRPEHGNRGDEIEPLMLVDATEWEAMRSVVDASKLILLQVDDVGEFCRADIEGPLDRLDALRAAHHREVVSAFRVNETACMLQP
jgi:hypothetical protein